MFVLMKNDESQPGEQQQRRRQRANVNVEPWFGIDAVRSGDADSTPLPPAPPHRGQGAAARDLLVFVVRMEFFAHFVPFQRCRMAKFGQSVAVVATPPPPSTTTSKPAEFKIC